MSSSIIKPRAGRETILVVEDEPVLRDLVKLLLTSCGYQVLSVACQAQAMSEWHGAKGKVDLLLADMWLSNGESGRELAACLRREKSNLKILFTSAFPREEFQAELSEYPGSRFIQKPFTKTTLAQAVRECLED